MLKTILVPLCSRDDHVALSTAGSVAHLFDAHIDAIYVHPASDQLATAAGASMVVGAQEYVASLQDLDRNYLDAAKQAFSSFLGRCQITQGAKPGMGQASAAFHEHTGELHTIIIKHARLHELMVVGPAVPITSDGVRLNLGKIILESGRPILFVPNKPVQAMETIAVAWKNSAEAARAVTAAMSFLLKAKRVIVLSAQEEDESPYECVDCVETLAKLLEWHGIRSEARYVLPAGLTIANALLETAQQRGADMLVTGAYGHSRLRETVFGGVTRRLLEGTDIPILMAH